MRHLSDRAVLIPRYLLNEHYDDRYFDVVNAVEEAKHIFFEGCAILDMISATEDGKKKLLIGETGFGAGRVLVALLNYLEDNGTAGVDITYNSVELHPITSERMSAILSGFKTTCGPIIDLLLESYGKIDITGAGWQRTQLVLPVGTLTLNLWIGEALEMVRALNIPCDAWFLDGHGPKKNPSIWRPELLLAIGEKTRRSGACATYTVAGDVRRGLSAAGFSVEQRPGFGGKKSVLRGVRL